MARKPLEKELVNSRLLKEYASWVYCDSCGKTVAYLCYVTYNAVEFDYECGCGSRGKVHISFEHDEPTKSDESLKLVKNRLCCPNDDSPLFTIVEKNINSAEYRVVCNKCGCEFKNSEE